MADEVYTWHDAVYQARVGARLHFWRFSFAPNYDHDRILVAITDIMSKHGIRSYTVYETFGEYDVMLRAWVPREITAEDLGIVFDEGLSHLSLYQHDYAQIYSTFLHWAWQDVTDGETTPPAPTAEDLTIVDDANVVELDSYNSVALAATLSNSPVPKEPPKWVGDYVKRNLLRPISVGLHGVKFYVRFDQPRRPLRRMERDSITRRMRLVLSSAAVRARSSYPELEHDVQLQLYVGTGPMTDFLIIGRAPDRHFYSFTRDLIYHLHDLDLDHTHYMRTYTQIFSHRDFIEFVESPLSQVVGADISLLNEPESESVEFKATFAFDVHRYLMTKEREASKAVTESIVKAVCGLLNAPAGGRLVIGALELERELERVRDRAAALELLSSEFPIYPAADGGRYNPNAKAVIGIEADFDDWDRFVLRLEELLRNNINPAPLAYISIQRLPYRGRTLAVVKARPSTNWFYARAKDTYEFFVRELASTRAYYGPEADMYRRAAPRGDLAP